MNERYAEYASEFFDRSIRGRFPSVEGVGIARLNGDTHFEREMALVVQLDGAQQARKVFREMSAHLGQTQELISQPERNNTILDIEYLPKALFPSAGGLMRPGGKWLCQLGSHPTFELPSRSESQHPSYSIEEALELRFMSEDEELEEQDRYLLSLLVAVAEVLEGFEKLAEVRLCPYSQGLGEGRAAVNVAIDTLSSVHPLRKFLPAAVDAVSSINTLLVVEASNANTRGWTGKYVAVVSQYYSVGH